MSAPRPINSYVWFLGAFLAPSDCVTIAGVGVGAANDWVDAASVGRFVGCESGGYHLPSDACHQFSPID
jgi:hypothetical protein